MGGRKCDFAESTSCCCIVFADTPLPRIVTLVANTRGGCVDTWHMYRPASSACTGLIWRRQLFGYWNRMLIRESPLYVLLPTVSSETLSVVLRTHITWNDRGGVKRGSAWEESVTKSGYSNHSPSYLATFRRDNWGTLRCPSGCPPEPVSLPWLHWESFGSDAGPRRMVPSGGRGIVSTGTVGSDCNSYCRRCCCCYWQRYYSAECALMLMLLLSL